MRDINNKDQLEGANILRVYQTDIFFENQNFKNVILIEYSCECLKIYFDEFDLIK